MPRWVTIAIIILFVLTSVLACTIGFIFLQPKIISAIAAIAFSVFGLSLYGITRFHPEHLKGIPEKAFNYWNPDDPFASKRFQRWADAKRNLLYGIQKNCMVTCPCAAIIMAAIFFVGKENSLPNWPFVLPIFFFLFGFMLIFSILIVRRMILIWRDRMTIS